MKSIELIRPPSFRMIQRDQPQKIICSVVRQSWSGLGIDRQMMTFRPGPLRVLCYRAHRKGPYRVGEADYVVHVFYLL